MLRYIDYSPLTTHRSPLTFFFSFITKFITGSYNSIYRMKIKCSVLFYIAAVIGLASCKNNDSVLPAVVPPTGITVINASPDTLNFYLNGSRENGTSAIYPGGSSGLKLVPSGLQNYEFKKAGQPLALFGLRLKLRDSTFNSVYLTGESADKAFETVDTIPQLDTLSAVRFVNAAPDAGILNVSVGDTVKFNARAFKSSSIFLITGNGQKEVKVYLAGFSTPKIDTTITIQPLTVYTLFTKGLLNGKGASVFSLGILVNQLSAN